MIRLFASAIVAFIAYGVWTYIANMHTTLGEIALLRTSLLQGGVSATITFGFTLLTHWMYQRLGLRMFSFAFITPLICLPHHHTPYASQFRLSANAILNHLAQRARTTRFTGALLAPLLPVCLQAGIITTVHIINQTPNLILTIAPSIIFSAIYGYIYTFSLIKQKNTEHH